MKDAAKIIADKNVGSVLIVKEGKLVGIFTERGLAKLVAKGVSLDTPLSEVMTKNVHTVHADDPLVKAVYLMVEYNIRHVPVVDAEGKPIRRNQRERYSEEYNLNNENKFEKLGDWRFAVPVLLYSLTSNNGCSEEEDLAGNCFEILTLPALGLKGVLSRS